MKLKHGAAKRSAVKLLATALFIMIAVLSATPFVVVHIATAGHIDYGVREHPLQKIYDSEYFNLDANELYLTTEDGYQIWASEIQVNDPKAIIIYLTGIRQPSVTYYYGHSKWMKENGYGSFLLEVRGHGKSDGDKVCLGYEEVKDVRALLDYINEQAKYRDVPIVIQGVSMGGAIAINSFGLYSDLDGLIAASAYSSFEDTVYSVMRHYHIPALICDIEKPLVRLALQLSFGDKVCEITPIKQVENIGQRPALLIAATDDPEVPHENMFRLLEKAPAHCESWLRDSADAGHFIMMNHEFENVALDVEYCERILGFLERNFAQ